MTNSYIYFVCLLVQICTLLSPVKMVPTYSLSFQADGQMDDSSVNVYAKLKTEMPQLIRFTVCTWVKFHFERTFMTVWSYCAMVPIEEGSKVTTMKCSQLNFEKDVLTVVIADQSSTININ